MSLPVDTLRRSERLRQKAPRNVDMEEAEQPTAKTTSHENLNSRGNEKKADNISKSLKSKSSVRSRKEKLRLEMEMKKKEIAFKQKEIALEHQQEMMDLQLALQLAEIDDEAESEDSVSTDNDLEVHHPNIDNWEKGNNPWVDNLDCPENKTTEKVGSNNLFKNDEQIASYHLNKILTRQSIPQDLPIFSGDPMEWPNFIFNYRNTTAICGYSPEENLCRLQKSLKGHARKIVESLLILPSNVDKIIRHLEQRFGRSEQIIMLLLNKIRNFPFIKPDRLDLLINFSDEVNNVVGTIENLEGTTDHLRNPILLQELLDKLPNNLKLNWIEFTSSRTLQKPKIIEFSLWLERKASFACQIQPLDVSVKSDYDRHKPAVNFGNKRHATFATDNVQGYIKKCPACNKNERNHLSKCPKFLEMNIKQRWDFVTSKRLCFSCLLPGHNVKMCKKSKSCDQEGCVKPHHKLLHTGLHETKTKNDSYIQTDVNGFSLTTTTVILKMLPVVLSKGDQKVNTFALLDDASTVTLIDQDLADKLGLEGPRHSLCIQWTNDQTNVQDDSRVVSCDIAAPESTNKYQLRRIRTIKGMSLPTQTVNMNDVYKKYPYLNNSCNIPSLFNAKPLLLIGQDNWPLIVNRKIVTGPWNSPAMSKTLLGWTLHGNIPAEIGQRQGEHQVNYTRHGEKDDLDLLHDMVKKQWQVDTFGLEKISKPMSKEDVRAQNIMDKTMRCTLTEDRMETGLLWRDENIILPESRTNAMKRLFSTERKMDKISQFGQTYCEKMLDLENKGYIRKLDKNEATDDNPKTWYLPHFGITNPNKPNKLRIVFDAASKSNGVSLNDCLLTGPDLYNSLYSILLNFRIKKFAFTADIKEMFLQVQVRKEDRCAQRILWRGMDRDREPDTYEICVVFFGSTCGPCLAQEAKNKNAMEFMEQFPEAAKAIIQDHYMDDYLGNADTEADGIKLVQDIINVHKKGGFIICNWFSNSKLVLSEIDDSLRAQGARNLDESSQQTSERILGVWWNPETDTFSFQTKFHKIDKEILENNRRPTKREILKVVMSVFDPLGFLINVLIQGKILLQDAFRYNLGWDDEIPDVLFEKWTDWLTDLKYIFNFQLPRQYFTLDRSSSILQLHVFTDSSEKAYSTIAYLRIQQEDNIQVAFVTAKARVAPLKPLSIPRLELQGALMGARLGNFLKENLRLNISNIFFWTDSKTVLHWIRSDSGRFKVFVAQRLGEIQDLTNTTQWRYVPSKLNPADQATKKSTLDFSETSSWLCGPTFLKQNFSNWPQEKETKENLECKDIFEYKNDTVLLTLEQEYLIVPDPRRFSKWNRLRRATAWMIRFVKICKKEQISDELESNEIEDAETLLFKKVQIDSFSKEVKELKNEKTVQKNSRLWTLSPELDKNGIIRLKGRLNNLEQMNHDFKNPIILDSKHPITKLIIQYYHEKCFHHGQEVVINKIRQKFWILQVRQAVKYAFRNCQRCKVKRALPQPPLMGQLPLCRLEPTIRCFVKTGIDYFGPIKVAVKRSSEKRYGVIFTCMVTRAIHLEIAHDLSTNSFIHVLRQFGCRRGFPTEIYSDNGGNFKCAERELYNELQSLNQTSIKNFCSLNNIKWNFNPPLAPHMGGTWERLIQCVKKVMYELLDTRCPQEYVLRTIFAEAENMVNSRPLTHISVDPDDLEPITPNHFLIGPLYSASPCAITDEADLNLLSKWKAAQKLSDHFWKRWLSEYMPFLVKRSKWHEERTPLKEGAVVVVIDSIGPRNIWPKGRIIQVYPGKDGRVRTVDVKLANGSVLRRPATKICQLEVEKKSEE